MISQSIPDLLFLNFCVLAQALLLVDFASEMQLGGCSGYSVTCETGKTCNLYVVLVLYKIEGVIKCDHVR